MPVKGDNVNSRIKRQIIELLFLYPSKKIQNISEFVLLFKVLVTKQPLDDGFGFPSLSEMPTLHAGLKI